MQVMPESTEISHSFERDNFRRARQAFRAGIRMTLAVETSFVRQEACPLELPNSQDPPVVQQKIVLAVTPYENGTLELQNEKEGQNGRGTLRNQFIQIPAEFLLRLFSALPALSNGLEEAGSGEG